MRPLEYRINLDFANESSDIFCNVRQGDNCSKIVAALREDGRAYDIEGDNLSVVFAALKSDGNTIYDDCTVENNTIIYDFNNQTAPVSGTVPCQFILIDSENGEVKRISTPVFFLEISDNVDIDEENIVSSESYTALTNKIAQAQALINQIQHDLDTGAYKGDKGDDGFSPTATVTKSGHTATITITDKNGTTTAEISDGEGGDGDTAFVNVQIADIDTATAPNRFYIVLDGHSVHGLLRFSGNVSTGAAAISVSQIMYTRTGELLKRIGTTSYGSVTWTGDWEPITSKGSGVTIINAETVPESANWDVEIPTTYAGQTGEKGEIAFWNGELWYLYNVATLKQTTYYHWDKVAVTEDLEAKMDLAPLNPTAEQIAALPSGQLYSDTAKHKGVIKGGQEFYDTTVAVRVFENNDGQSPPLQTYSSDAKYHEGDIWINLSYQSSERVCTALYICKSIWTPSNYNRQYRWLCLYGTNSEYYTKNEIDQKGYLTLETLPIYDGTVI